MGNEYFKADKLLEPLPEEELMLEFKKFYNGDMQARENIIMHNLRLIYFRIYKCFTLSGISRNEMFSIGIEALIKSVDTYDQSKKIKFNTYASKCIDNEILMAIRKNKTQIKTLNCSEIDTNDDLNELSYLENYFIDESSYIDTHHDNKELFASIVKAIETLPKIVKKQLFESFGLNGLNRMTQKELAQKYNLNQSEICRNIRHGIQHIRYCLYIEGFIERKTDDFNFKIK